jgi:type IV secretory pathway TraG/TraD family ATPase VirD4
MGSTGTGKSTAIRELLRAALDRGDRAIIADPDGGYLDIFYDASRNDVILNPFEPDALKWDLFGEITRVYDIEQIARALIPDLGGEERVWSEYARTFFGAVTQQLIRAGTRDDKTLHRLIRSADEDELRELLAGTAAGPFLREGSERMFGSLRSVASTAVRVLEHTVEQQARPFSVRQWVREGAARQAGGKGGVLFLPYRASQIASLRSVISAWMRLGIFEAMDRPAGDQRLWFIVDELDALGTIDGLKDALARLRKFGGRCVLGFQSIAQVSGTYGREVADTLVENCGNTLILRCSASERGGTSEFASKLIGQREMLHTTQSKTRRGDEESTTNSQQIRIEPAVMASEVERLPDLSGFLKIASRPDWQRVSLVPVRYPAVIRDSHTPAAATTVSSLSDPPVAGESAATLPRPVAEPLGGAESAR